MSKAMSLEALKKVPTSLLAIILAGLIILSVVAVVRAAEESTSPAKEGMKTEEIISEPASGQSMQAPAEAVQGVMSETDKSGNPAAQEESQETAKKEAVGGGK